jgi:protein kinase-like protein
MERWATVKRLHQAALERDSSERAAFLADACAGDEALRHEVESLLAYDTSADSFMESPALDVAARSANPPVFIPLAGRSLGPYHVQSLLGAGGMGEVYLAVDSRLDRAVALKILPGDLTGDSDRLQRFIREAKAASALNHPNVATIHDIGERDGVHFIVMEYVEGRTLTDRIADQPLSSKEITAFSLFIQALAALECGRPEESMQLATESKAAAVASGDVWLQSVPLIVYAAAEWNGDRERAGQLLGDTLKLARQTGHTFLIIIALANLATIRVLQERYDDVRELGAEGMLLCQEVEDRRGASWTLESLAAAEAAGGQAVRAARLWGAADQLLESVGAPLNPLFRQLRDYVGDVSKSCGDRAFQGALSEGRAMSLQQAVQYALTDISRDHVPDDDA